MFQQATVRVAGGDASGMAVVFGAGRDDARRARRGAAAAGGPVEQGAPPLRWPLLEGAATLRKPAGDGHGLAPFEKATERDGAVASAKRGGEDVASGSRARGVQVECFGEAAAGAGMSRGDRGVDGAAGVELGSAAILFADGDSDRSGLGTAARPSAGRVGSICREHRRDVGVDASGASRGVGGKRSGSKMPGVGGGFEVDEGDVGEAGWFGREGEASRLV